MEKPDSITGFEPDTLRELKDALVEALDDIEKRFGMKVSIGTFNYNDVSATCKLTMKCRSFQRPNGEIISGEQRAFEIDCKRFGLHENDYGRVVTIGGEKVAIRAIQPSAKKLPIVVEAVDAGPESRYKVSADIIRALLLKET